MNGPETYDYIVVGAGTAGMVATLLVLAALAVAINLAVRGLERMVRWW